MRAGYKYFKLKFNKYISIFSTNFTYCVFTIDASSRIGYFLQDWTKPVLIYCALLWCGGILQQNGGIGLGS